MPKEIDTKSWKIDRIILQISEGQIKIPPLQRPFVWKIDQIIKLLESIYNDYPVGSVLLWGTNLDLPAARNVAGFIIPEREPDYPVYYVLDGQQRLSTLYGVFSAERISDENPPGYEINHDIFEIFFDLGDKKFVHASDKEDGKRYFEIKYLLNNVKFHEQIKDLSDQDKETATSLQTSFLGYEIPLVVTTKRNKEEVGIIFERINNSGTPLALFDLMVAWTWTDDFHLREKYSEVMDVLESKNFEGIQEKIILQCLSGIIKKSTKSKEIVAINPGEVRDSFDLFVESLKKAIDYFSTELCVKSIDLLPHAHQIVPLCYLFSKINTPTINQKRAINEWFWKTSFSRRYAASTDTHIDEDIKSFDRLVEEGALDVFSGLSYSVTEEQLINTKFIKSSAYSRALIVLLATKKPLNLVNGSAIDTGDALSAFNRREYHHVFPRAFLEKRGVSPDSIASLCNFCILPSDSNKIISDKAPSDYFRSVIPTKSYQEILESNLLPLINELYSKDNFDGFLKERARKIIEYLNSQFI